MARIAGVDLPREKRVQVGLTYVYGIGQTTANKILAATGINPDTRVKDLTLDDEAKIRDYIDQANILVEGDLRRNVALDIKRLVEDPVLPWHPPSQEPALPWPAHQDQCTYLQGPEAHGRQQEEVRRNLRNGKC